MIYTHVLYRGGRGVQSPADRLLAGFARDVRAHGMTANRLACAPGDSTASNVDSTTCVIACPEQSRGLADSFCWVCRNDWDVEL
jgi:hypothetical protein